MAKILCLNRKGEVILEPVPDPTITTGNLIIRTTYSAISGGTETIGYNVGGLGTELVKHSDRISKVTYKIKQNGLKATCRLIIDKLIELTPQGYSGAGIVEAIGDGAIGFKIGDRVAYAGHPHSDLVICPTNMVVHIPDDVKDIEASFTTIACIAMHGVRLCNLELGETALVIGLGQIGNYVVQMLKASGVRVIGADLSASRLNKALEVSLDFGFNACEDIVRGVMEITHNIGVDGILLCADTKTSETTNNALLCARDRARVVMVGNMCLNLERPLMFGKELTFLVSRSYGPGRYDFDYEQRGRDYPIGYVRWTQKRNMEAVLGMLSQRSLKISTLDVKDYEFENASHAYRDIVEKSDYCLAVCLRYPKTLENQKNEKVYELKRSEGKVNKKVKGNVKVALVGVGSFAMSTLVPALRANKAIIRATVARNGISAVNAAKKVGAEYSHTDYRFVLEDPDIDLVVIATRHNLHYEIAMAAIEEGKAVHVEKPMSMNLSECQDIVKTVHEHKGFLTVGYNRRFSSMVQDVRNVLKVRSMPMTIIYRVNANRIPLDHWVNDPIEGGGRLVGEGCHFIDLICYLVSKPYKSILYQDTPASPDQIGQDNFSLTIGFEDGSIGVLIYTSQGNSGLPKELIEVHQDGESVIIDNFTHLKTYGFPLKNRKLSRADKGFEQYFEKVFESLEKGTKPETTEVDGLLVAEIIDSALSKGGK